MLKFKEILNEEHEGFGGMYFLISNYLCAIILSTAFQLSWQSQAVAMADNLAYIAATNTLVQSYISNSSSYDSGIAGAGFQVNTTNRTYSPLNDFNNMLTTGGLSAGQSSQVRAIYDASSHTLRIQFGSFDTILGVKVTPHEQDTIIEAF